MSERTTTSAEGTQALGKELATKLTPGDLVLLEGDLGTGKTTFVQGIAEGLGVAEPPTSPSFVIVQEYPLALHPAPFILRHIDLYRLPDPTVDLDRLGLAELLNDPAAVTVVEWADRLPRSLQPAGRTVRVHLRHGGQPSERRITLWARESSTGTFLGATMPL